MSPSSITLVAALAAASTFGCASRGSGWGASVATDPFGSRSARAAVDAAKAPGTWVPVAAALAIAAADLDERISDWASSHTPLFGSRDRAGTASDDLRFATGAAYVLTALATPSGESLAEVAANKAAGLAVGLGTHGLTTGLVGAVKDESERVRPDGSSDESFPSGHAASASVRATLASRNARAISMHERSRRALQLTCAAAAVACAWARVEAGVHYPTDVLTGLALGHFLGAFVNDALIGTHVSASTSRGGARVQVTLTF